ncbi:hypothetical protein, partial [Flavobacterium sp. NKUCC04_CG]|uniref:hypothetical protein n=1 Tax=Flavobacterium sp. NKUCC04_CG TaxID=2842121 RepID=UPI001C5B5DF8
AVSEAMFLDNREQYDIEYYSNRADAVAREHQIENAAAYILKPDNSQRIVYLRIEQLELECVQIYEIPIIYTTGELPEQRADIIVCGSYVFPNLSGNQFYYSQAGGKGESYKGGESIVLLGTHKIYVLQQNGESGCYEESNYNVTVEADVRADVIEDA